MRAASDDLKTLLNNNNVEFIADLFTLDLRVPLGTDSAKGVSTGVKFSGGTTCKWTTGDSNLSGFSCAGPTMKRGGVRHTAGLEVGTMTLDMGGGWTFPDTATTKIQAAAIGGAFDGAWVKVERLFMPTWGDVSRGTINWFEGVVSTVEPSSTAVRLTFKDPRAQLDQPYPKRLYQAGCPYALFDNRCLLTPVLGTNYWTNGVVVGAPAGPTLTTIAMSGNHPLNTYARGVVTFTSGVLTGVRRTVISSVDYAGSYHAMAFSGALPSIPAVGTTFEYTLGCDGTIDACLNKFDHGGYFGGYPYVPKPETIR